MRLSTLGLVLALLVPAHARADDTGEIIVKLQELPANDELKQFPKFAISGNLIHVGWTTGNVSDLLPGTPGDGKAKLEKVIVAKSGDSKVAWIAADVRGVRASDACAPGPCAPITQPPMHATALLERVGSEWRWVAWHITEPTTFKEQRQAHAEGTVPDVLARSVTKADDVVAVFQTSILDPSALAASVSDRKDVVLYGSAANERYVGGAKVKKQLAAWKLAFTIRDGIQAGVAGDGKIAWVAANVDAVPLKNPLVKPMPYRVLAIYELNGAKWRLVQAHFSVDVWTWTGKTK